MRGSAGYWRYLLWRGGLIAVEKGQGRGRIVANGSIDKKYNKVLGRGT